MKYAVTFLALVVVSSPLKAGEKGTEPVVPTRYQPILQTKKTRLVEFLGNPEQQPALGHTAAFAAGGKVALFTNSGASDPDTGQFSDGTLTVWDVDQGRLVREIIVPGEAVSALAISADGNHALTGMVRVNAKGETSSRVVWWNLSAGKEVHSFPTGVDLVACVAVSDKGKGLAGTLGGDLHVLHLKSGKMGIGKSKKGPRILDVAFDKSGSKALSTWDDQLKLWDLHEGKKDVRTFKGHQEWVMSAALSPDDKYAVSASVDDQVRLWEITTGKEIGLLKKGPFNRSLVSLAFVGDRRVVVAWSARDPMTATQDQSFVTLWDGTKELWTRKLSLKGLAPIAVRDSEHVLLGGGANPFYLLKLADGSVEKAWGGHKGAVMTLARHAERLYSAGQDGSFLAWTKDGPQPFVAAPEADRSTAVPMIVGPLPGFPLTRSDHAFRLVSFQAGQTDQVHKGHTGTVTSLALQGKLLASGSADRTIKIWRDGKAVLDLVGHSDAVNAVAWSPKGNLLASVSDDASVRIWDVKSLLARKRAIGDPEPKILEDHKRQATCLLFLSDNLLLSGSQDMTIKLWDVAKGRVVRSFVGHKNWITSMIQVGPYLVSASDDLTVRLWDIKTAKEVDRIDLAPCSDGPRCLLPGGRPNTFHVGTAGWVILQFQLRE